MPATSPSDQCDKIDTGGYQVTTTLDWKMQATTEKWLYAAARAPNLREHPTRASRTLKIPAKDWGWLKNLRGKNIHNAAVGGHGLPDRPGPRLRGLGQLHRAGHEEVPAAVRRPVGRLAPARDPSIKPINYAIGIEDQTMTAATMFMDVTTDFGGKFIPTQADKPSAGRSASARPSSSP